MKHMFKNRFKQIILRNPNVFFSLPTERGPCYEENTPYPEQTCRATVDVWLLPAAAMEKHSILRSATEAYETQGSCEEHLPPKWGFTHHPFFPGGKKKWWVGVSF